MFSIDASRFNEDKDDNLCHPAIEYKLQKSGKVGIIQFIFPTDKSKQWEGRTVYEIRLKDQSTSTYLFQGIKDKSLAIKQFPEIPAYNNPTPTNPGSHI